MIGASCAGTAITPITRPSRFGPAAWTTIVCASGSSIPPPRPWSTRNAIRLPIDQASPHSIEPARKSAIAVIHTRLAPNRSAAQPVSGITTASASRYAVLTHWIVATVVWNSRPSVSSATLTIVVSRIAGTAPTSTAMQSRISGVSRRSGAAVSVIMRYSVSRC